PVEVGLPRGPRINLPFRLNTKMSGVNGLLAENSPPGHAVSSLQTLGRPCPDSRTNTWKLFALPRKAIPVGALRLAANTDAVNPGGRLIDGGKFGLKNAVLFIQSGAVDGFDTVCAKAAPGSANKGVAAKAMLKSLRRMATTPPYPRIAKGMLLLELYAV